MCQEALRIVKEGTIEEMEQYFRDLNEEAVQERRQWRGECHSAFVGNLFASAAGGAETLQ